MLNKEQISANLEKIAGTTSGFDYTLVAVTKTHPLEVLQSVYDLGVRDFGENKVQDMVSKHETLPKDIRWHFIGHLQRNKVKYMAPFVHLVHSVDSERLLKEIDKQGEKNSRVINCLLQLHIAKEETKFGLDEDELKQIVFGTMNELKNVRISGLMGMATNSSDKELVKSEFGYLRELFNGLKNVSKPDNVEMTYLSMGMSQDYLLALEEGSNMLRVGSTIFGPRNYPQ